MRNGGTLTSLATVEEFWLSADATRDVSDVQLTGSRAVTALAPAATSVGTAALTIPSATTPGTYYLIACVDVAGAVAESDDANNCRSSTTTVSVTVPFVDLRVLSMTAPPATSLTGGTLKPATVVKNFGTGAAGASSVEYVLSADQVVDGGDVLLAGSRPSAALAGGASNTGTPTLTISPSTPVGTYYVLACVDSVDLIDESDEANNCLASATTTTVSVPIADLRVSALSNPPATALTGGTLSPSTGVTNGGTGPSLASTVELWLSADGDVGPGDIELVGQRSVPVIAAAATSTAAVTVTIPADADPGTYLLLACADASTVNAESDETNNCRASLTSVVVTIPTPDLRVTALSAVPAIGLTGGQLKPSVTVTNAGTGAAGASTTRYYLSLDSVVDGSDVAMGTTAVPTLAAKATNVVALTLSVPSDLDAGSYRLIACSDDDEVVDEITESDNCRVSTGTVAISDPIADLTVTALTNPVTTRTAGQTLTVTATVTNPGTAAADASVLQAWLSLDAVVGTDVQLQGSRSVPSLAAKATSPGSFTATLPSAMAGGSYFLIVCADAGGVVSESSESNNCRISTMQVAVSAASGGMDTQRLQRI